LKLQWPFVDKGGYALASVMGRDDPGKFGLLYGKAVVDRGIETTVNGGQRSTYGKRWFGCKHFSQSQRFGNEICFCHVISPFQYRRVRNPRILENSQTFDVTKESSWRKAVAVIPF
jgi:hypothetical protein